MGDTTEHKKDFQLAWLMRHVKGLQNGCWFGTLTLKFEDGIMVFKREETTQTPPLPKKGSQTVVNSSCTSEPTV